MKRLSCLVVALVLLTVLSACPLPPVPLKDGSCPGRVLNFRETPIGVSIFRQEAGQENFHVGFNVAAKSSTLISLPAGKFAVRIVGHNNNFLSKLEILVAVENSTTFILKPQPELGVKEELVYWWVSQK